MNTALPIYKDFWFKIIGSLIASQIIDALNREESYFERFTSKYFYTDLLGGFIIALVLWEVVRFVTRYLDKKYDWMAKPVQRILLQIALGVFIPSLLSFFFTFAFMKFAYNQDIFQTSWLFNEFYAVILIIILINLIYFTWWLYLKWKNHHAEKASDGRQIQTENFLPDILSQTINTQNLTIEVTKAGKIILLPHNEIAYAYLNASYCYIKTIEEDSFMTTYTLDEISRMLGENRFFRANRQILISKKSCKAYQSIENGKIELELNPAFKIPVIVSQKRAKDFRKWVSAVPQC